MHGITWIDTILGDMRIVYYSARVLKHAVVSADPWKHAVVSADPCFSCQKIGL